MVRDTDTTTTNGPETGAKLDGKIETPENRDAPYTIATYVAKGGTGKTTTTGHFGAAYAEGGLDTLLIDLAGRQDDLSTQFGISDEIEHGEDRWPNIATTFTPQWDAIVQSLGEDAAIDSLIFETDEGVDLIPTHDDLDSTDSQLGDEFADVRRFQQLDAFLREHIYDRYDVILIDLPGAADNVAYNGVWAAQHVMAPALPGVFESSQVESLRGDIEILQREHGRNVGLRMLIPNRIRAGVNRSAKYVDKFADDYPDVIAPSTVPDCAEIGNAQELGRTLFGHDQESIERSSTAPRALHAYRRNARELLRRIDVADGIVESESADDTNNAAAEQEV